MRIRGNGQKNCRHNLRLDPYSLIDLGGLEGAGVVVERLVRHLLVHHVWQPQLRQHPLAPIPRRVLVRLRAKRSVVRGRRACVVGMFTAI